MKKHVVIGPIRRLSSHGLVT